MGMFDSVIARCPQCGEAVEFQSKAGDCQLLEYSSQAVPAEIAVSLDGCHATCHACGYMVTLRLREPVKSVPMSVE